MRSFQQIVVGAALSGLLVPSVTRVQAASPAAPTIAAVPGSARAASTCTLGESGPVGGCACSDYGVDQGLLKLLSVAECPDCDGVNLTTAHAWIWFNGTCSVTLQVRIVGAVGDSACAVPDITAELCPPMTYTISPPAAGLHDVAMPLPAGCCVTRDAFLEIVSRTSPRACYFASGTTGVAEDDACGTYALVAGEVRPPGQCGAVECVCPWAAPCSQYDFDYVMYVDTACCQPTATPRDSWGTIKTLYR